jgi:signal peptidase II
MPRKAGTRRVLSRVPVCFWIVAALWASADLFTKHAVFQSFPQRFPEAVKTAEAARTDARLRLARSAAGRGYPELGRLAEAGPFARFAQRAERLGERDLARAARQADGIHPPYPAVRIVDGFFHIVCGRNYGGVFGSGQGVPTVWLAVGALAGALVIWFAHKKDSRAVPVQIALGLVMGGAVGNLFDRVAFGYVRDFIEVYYWPGKAWPAFNVADAGICVGAAYLALHALIILPRQRRREQAGGAGKKGA